MTDLGWTVAFGLVAFTILVRWEANRVRQRVLREPAAWLRSRRGEL